MTLPREPFDWDGPEDEPIFLEVLPSESAPSEGWPKIPDEAERLGRSAQAALARQGTDPSITIPSPPPAFQPETAGGLIARSLSRRTLALLLTMSCGLAFAHGWTTGAIARPNPHSHSCDAGHCQPNKSSKEWKEEQHP